MRLLPISMGLIGLGLLVFNNGLLMAATGWLVLLGALLTWERVETYKKELKDVRDQEGQ